MFVIKNGVLFHLFICANNLTISYKHINDIERGVKGTSCNAAQIS